MLCNKHHTTPSKIPLEQEVVLGVSVLAAFLFLHTFFHKELSHGLLGSRLSSGSPLELEERQGKNSNHCLFLNSTKHIFRGMETFL